MVSPNTGSPRAGVAAALAAVWVVWGSTYVALRVGVRSLPPLTMAGTRFAVAGLLLWCWCWWQRRRRPGAGWRPVGLREWRASAITGLLVPAAGTGGATWAEQELPAGLTALLLASIPVWLVLASHVAGLERITGRAAAGLLLGLAGVAVLVDPFSAGAPGPLAAAVALGGALCWGCGSVYAKLAPAARSAAAGQQHAAHLRRSGTVRGRGRQRGTVPDHRGGADLRVSPGPGLPDRVRQPAGLLQLRVAHPARSGQARRHLRLRQPGGRGPARLVAAR